MDYLVPLYVPHVKMAIVGTPTMFYYLLIERILSMSLMLMSYNSWNDTAYIYEIS